MRCVTSHGVTITDHSTRRHHGSDSSVTSSAISAGPSTSVPYASRHRPGGNRHRADPGAGLEHRRDQNRLAEQELIMDGFVTGPVVRQGAQDRLAGPGGVPDQTHDLRQQRR